MHAHCYACKEWLSDNDSLHEAMFIEDNLIEIKYREHIQSFIPDIHDLSPIQNKKRPFGMDLGPNSEE